MVYKSCRLWHLETMMIRLLFLLTLLLAQGTSRAAAPAWLVGCWQSADGRTKEVWVQESEHVLLGFSASARDDTIGFYELLRIHRDETGTWVFTAWPSGQTRTDFRASSVGADAIVFRNPEHDYPQEVQYRRNGNQLEATVSLLNGKERMRFDKAGCN